MSQKPNSEFDSHSELFSLLGKTAAVIGGGGHVCSALARGFASAGANVAIIDLRIEKAESVAKEISNDFGVKTIGIYADATKLDELNEMMESLIKFSPKIEIAVNGGGINSPEPFLDIKEEEWHKVVDSQLTATYLGCQVFGKHMLENKNGSIINISSASADPALSKAYAYSAAKAGIRNLTQNLGREWGKSGVRVNAIRPGFFPTEWNRKNFITPDREAAILNHTPMGRFGETSELIGAAIYLASAASNFVTGSELIVDGGFSAMTI
jgi:NAD(P)-dependent dehydrogenase (short-subunit alcohol dehydrogenase family)